MISPRAWAIGFPDLQTLDQRDLFDIGEDKLGGLKHQPRPLGTRHARPGTCIEGAAGGSDGGAHIIRRRIRPCADDDAGMAGADAIDGFARLRVDRLAIDKHPVAGFTL